MLYMWELPGLIPSTVPEGKKRSEQEAKMGLNDFNDGLADTRSRVQSPGLTPVVGNLGQFLGCDPMPAGWLRA